MFRYILAAPACAILATAAAGAITSLSARDRDTAQSMVATVEAAPETGAADEGKPARTVRQASDGLFYAHALVNGHRVRFIVDTGSSVVVLTQADAARTGVGNDGLARIRVETAGGGTGMQMTKLRDVTIAGQKIDHVDAAIVASGLKVSLLGQSVLSRLDSVQFRKNELRLN